MRYSLHNICSITCCTIEITKSQINKETDTKLSLFLNELLFQQCRPAEVLQCTICTLDNFCGVYENSDLNRPESRQRISSI